MIAGGAGEHGGERLVGVEAADAFEIGVGDHRDRVIPDHRVGLVAGELPHGQASAFAVLGQKGLDEVAGALAFQ